MPLRPVSELGLSDAIDVAAVSGDERERAPSRRPGGRSRSARRPRRPSANGAAATQTAAEVPSAAAVTELKVMSAADEAAEQNVVPADEATVADEPSERKEVPLADEPPSFLQIMVPGELHERLNDASHALAADHRKLRHQKAILGALIWQHVDPDDPESLRALGATLDAYLSTDLAEAPAEIQAGAHLPFSLKHKLDGAALALRRTRRDASARTVLSALVWRHVDPGDLAPLVELLAAYHEVVRPCPIPIP